LEKKIGPDALDLEQAYFLEALAGRKTTIKGALLNQSIVAGLGNLYVDDLCYQLRIHPATKVNQLTQDQQKAIYHKIVEMMTYAGFGINGVRRVGLIPKVGVKCRSLRLLGELLTLWRGGRS